MTRDEAVALIKLRMGNNNLASLDALIVAEMKHVQDTLLEGAAFLPWFLEKTDDTVVTVADSRLVSFPTGFLREVPEQAIWLFGTAGDETTLTELAKGDADELNYLYGDETGSPKAYALFGESQFQLWPRPDAVYTLRVVYYGRDDVLSTDVTNKWLTWASDLVMAHVGNIVSTQYLQNPKQAAIYLKQVQAALTRLAQQHTARDEANRERRRGDA